MLDHCSWLTLHGYDDIFGIAIRPVWGLIMLSKALASQQGPSVPFGNVTGRHDNRNHETYFLCEDLIQPAANALVDGNWGSMVGCCCNHLL